MPDQLDSDETIDLGVQTHTWGALELVEKVGQGGFGEVYRARDSGLDREVALKLLRLGRESAIIKSEAKLLAKVTHENVAAVYGVAEHDGRVGLWMEFIHGKTLSQLVKAQGRLGPREATAIAIDVLRALSAVHAIGLLHCDIKAQNVMRAEGGRIVLMDFGLSQVFDRLGDSSRMAGTPKYMAPELFEGKPVSVQSDIYAVGVLLYFLVTGSYPIEASSLQEYRDHSRRRLLRDVRPDLPEPYLQIVERALADSPAARYETAGQMLQALNGNWTAADSQVVTPAPAVSRRQVLAYSMLGGAAVLGSGAFAYWRFRPGSKTRFIAVLPLENLTRDPENDYFSDGITEELITALARVPGLRVVGRTSVFRFKGQHPDPKTVGQQLGVDSILSGAVRKSEDRIRASVNLVSARDGFELWSDVYERPLKDTFSVQESIAQTVAVKLQLQFASASQSPRRDFTAADADYLRGLFHAAKSTPAELRQAIEYFTKTTAARPDFAPAWAALGDSWATLAFYDFYDPTVRQQANPSANAAISKALALDATLAQAYAAKSLLQLEYDWDWPAAEANALRATRENPGYAKGWGRYSTILYTETRYEEALEAARRSFELDPLSVPSSDQVGICLHKLNQFDAARKQFARSLELDPRGYISHVMLGWINVSTRQFPTAIAEMRAALDIYHSSFAITCLIAAYALSGDLASARRLQAESKFDHFTPVEQASVNAVLGDSDAAFRDLYRALAEHDPQIIQIQVNPALEPIRKDPRYAAILRTLKIDA